MRPFNYSTTGILSFKAPKRLPPCQVWTQLGHKKKIVIFSKTLHRRQLMVLSLGKRELITDAPSAKQQPRNKTLHSPSIPVNLCYLLRSHTFIGDLIFLTFGPYILHFYVDTWNKIPSMQTLPSFPSCGLMMTGDVQFCCCCQYSCTHRQQSGKTQSCSYENEQVLNQNSKSGCLTCGHCACFLPSTFFKHQTSFSSQHIQKTTAKLCICSY